MFVLVVSGGRSFANAAVLNAALDKVLRLRAPLVLFHGGCSGADHLAEQWALSRGVPARAFPALWNKFGKSAGPRRNRLMIETALKEGAHCGLVAFQGGAGTRNAIATAKQLGVGVWVV